MELILFDYFIYNNKLIKLINVRKFF